MKYTVPARKRTGWALVKPDRRIGYDPDYPCRFATWRGSLLIYRSKSAALAARDAAEPEDVVAVTIAPRSSARTNQARSK